MLLMKIQISNTPAALVRVLGMVERRCFSILSLNVELDESGNSMEMVIRVKGDRPSSKLTSQLQKLYVVEKLEVIES